MSFDAIKTLDLASAEGYTNGLDPAPYEKTHQPGYLRVFIVMAPLRMLVLSRCNFVEFGIDGLVGSGSVSTLAFNANLETVRMRGDDAVGDHDLPYAIVMCDVNPKDRIGMI